MPRPGIEDFQDTTRYRLRNVLVFEDMIPFVFENIKARGWMSVLYFIFNILMLLFFLGSLVVSIRNPVFGTRQILLQVGLGLIAGSILVIPLHELLHGMAYWILGARKIRFGMDLQQFIFYVTADRHAVPGLQVIFLAIFPFLLINGLAILLLLFVMPGMSLFISFFLLCHNTMYIGDFAISNYVLNSGGRLFTFDLPEERKSYFYEKIA
jgi:hypothetical protein